MREDGLAAIAGVTTLVALDLRSCPEVCYRIRARARVRVASAVVHYPIAMNPADNQPFFREFIL